MNKIVTHISNKASHTDPAKVPGVKTTLKQLKFTLLHDGLYNQRKKFNRDDNFNNACQRIQSETNKNN